LSYGCEKEGENKQGTAAQCKREVAGMDAGDASRHSAR